MEVGKSKREIESRIAEWNQRDCSAHRGLSGCRRTEIDGHRAIRIQRQRTSHVSVAHAERFNGPGSSSERHLAIGPRGVERASHGHRTIDDPHYILEYLEVRQRQGSIQRVGAHVQFHHPWRRAVQDLAQREIQRHAPAHGEDLVIARPRTRRHLRLLASVCQFTGQP